MKIAKLKMILAKSELSLVADPSSDYSDTALKDISDMLCGLVVALRL